MNFAFIKRPKNKPLNHVVRSLLILFVGITFVSLIVPLNPSMPVIGLDPSWAFAMNQAVAQSLVIGQDIVFTFGPYAGLFTRCYHPDTDRLVLGSSIYFAFCFLLMLAGLQKQRGVGPVLFFTLLAVFIFGGHDLLFFLYPLFLSVFIVGRLSATSENGRNIFLQSPSNKLLAVLLTPLGFLPLIKGSFLPICLVTIVLNTILFGYYKKFLWALLACLIPFASAGLFWVIAGQKLTALPDFFAALFPITSGYTEALARNGNVSEVFAYLFGVLVVLFAIARQKLLTIPLRIYLTGCYLFFFFNVFKAGFVRHDGHVILAAILLVFSCVTLTFLSGTKQIYISVLVSALLSGFITHGYNVDYLDSPRKLYSSAWSGLMKRFLANSELRKEYERRLSEIRKAEPMTRMVGTTDIYSTHQAALFASGNVWNPRPVFQSYSAYTPQLGKLNELHLRSSKAPDNLVFRVETIDERFPSLDDGWSWPAIWDNYAISNLDGNFIYFKKRNSLFPMSDFIALNEGNHELGEIVKVPESSEPIFVKIDIHPTVFGAIFATAYKPNQLWITINLQNGQTLKYRVIANMMQNGFLISPLTRKNWEMALVASGRSQTITANRVVSFSLDTLEKPFATWQSSYQLSFKSYLAKAVPKDRYPVLALTSETIPEGFTMGEPIKSWGAVTINELGVKSVKPSISGQLIVEGIVAISPKMRLPLDQFFITLRHADGRIRYGKAMSTARSSANYSRKKMKFSGISSLLDVSDLEGDWTFGIAIADQGKLWPCQKFDVPIMIVR